jgi:hypothetical protein
VQVRLGLLRANALFIVCRHFAERFGNNMAFLATLKQRINSNFAISLEINKYGRVRLPFLCHVCPLFLNFISLSILFYFYFFIVLDILPPSLSFEEQDAQDVSSVRLFYRLGSGHAAPHPGE